MQVTFAETELVRKIKQTRRARLLMGLEILVPRSVLESVIDPCCPKIGGKRSLSVMSLSRMFRMYILQSMTGFSDEGAEGSIYDCAAI